MEASVAQFEPFTTSLETAFWQRLIELKIDVLKLDDKTIPIHGHYGRGKSIKDRETGQIISLGCVMNLDNEAYDESEPSIRTSDPTITFKGHLTNFNTIEDFKKVDKPALFNKHAQAIWLAITRANSPTLQDLNPFFLLTFADLKKFKFTYWFAFPALVATTPWNLKNHAQLEAASHTRISPIYAQFMQFFPEQGGCGIINQSPDHQLSIEKLSDNSMHSRLSEEEKLTVIFQDPSTHETAIGWPLRNVLAYLSIRHGVKEVEVIAWRDDLSGRDRLCKSKRFLFTSGSYGATDTMPRAVGWEKNTKGKLDTRIADLGPIMDPARLADQAVDLNLKLMRWRIIPELDLERIKETRCLLLGAGTLGCYVARNLLGWGVRNITFLDSAKVSYSNPVRQPLFNFEDCLEGGKPKAEAAATALKRIYPGVNATGVQLSIPMPGHPIPPPVLDRTKREVEILEKLIEEHDVVYLLMDSRESRWLPTVIGASKRKLVMNAALGFDSYLVMRHGVPSDQLETPTEDLLGTDFKGKLGCYFCNDIVAPTDSLSDRTLDQMCTVTRPGLAAIASALSVELMVSVLQHPKGAMAPVDPPQSNVSEVPSALGLVPHQIRGYLAKFENLKILGKAYDRCTGCSQYILKEYRSEGFDFLLKAFNDAKHLEVVTGLDILQAESEAALDGIEDWDENEEDD